MQLKLKYVSVCIVHSFESLLNRKKDKEKIFHVFIDKLNSYLLNINTFRKWCLQHTQTIWDRGMFTTGTSPLLLITLCNRSGTEYINCCSFSSGIITHSCCIQALSCSIVCGRRCLILLFMMRHAFSIGDRFGLQTGQSSTHTLCLRSHAVETRAEWGLSLSCWNRHGVPGTSRHLDISIGLSKIPT